MQFVLLVEMEVCAYVWLGSPILKACTSHLGPHQGGSALFHSHLCKELDLQNDSMGCFKVAYEKNSHQNCIYMHENNAFEVYSAYL